MFFINIYFVLVSIDKGFSRSLVLIVLKLEVTVYSRILETTSIFKNRFLAVFCVLVGYYELCQQDVTLSLKTS